MIALARASLADLVGGGYFGDFASGDVDTGFAGFWEGVGPDVGAGFGVVSSGN